MCSHRLAQAAGGSDVMVFVITSLARTHFPFPSATPKASVNTETITLESWQAGFQCLLSTLGRGLPGKWERE